MDESRTPASSRSDSNDLFDTPLRESPGDKIRSALSHQAEPTFTVTLEILTVTAAVVIVLLIVVFYMGFLRGKDVERRDIARKISELRTRQTGSILLRTASVPSAPRTVLPAPMMRPAGAPADRRTAGTAVPAAPLTAPSALSKSVAIPGRKPYTVQAVTYRSQSRAQSEVTQLTQKGYAARMIVQGALYAVCVGEYSSRYEGQKDLRALKRIYPDSYLRKF